MPLWLIFVGAGILAAYLAKQAAAGSPFAIGQTCYLNGAMLLKTSGTTVTLEAGTRVYVQTSDSSGVTEVRTDSGNVGTVPTSSLSATLPAGTSMQVN